MCFAVRIYESLIPKIFQTPLRLSAFVFVVIALKSALLSSVHETMKQTRSLWEVNDRATAHILNKNLTRLQNNLTQFESLHVCPVEFT